MEGRIAIKITIKRTIKIVKVTANNEKIDLEMIQRKETFPVVEVEVRVMNVDAKAIIKKEKKRNEFYANKQSFNVPLIYILQSFIWLDSTI